MNATFTPGLQAGAVSLLLLGSAGPGMAQDPDQNLYDWQVRRLMQPLPHELKKEHSGGVYIYDGLTEKEVDAALDAHFARLQNMMFIGTKKTDSHGEPLRDAQTGQVMQESGGCSAPD